MKAKTILPLIMGVIVGGVAIKMVVDAVNRAEGAGRADLRQCVVAKMDIDFAEEITAEKLTVKDWPKDSLPNQFFSSVDELLGRVTNMPVPKDIPVYPTMLAPQGTPPGIQTRIKSGFRAVSVKINEISGVSYLLKPGDRVDVVSLVKRRRRNSNGVDTLSRIILQNVEIAAVGRTLARGNKRGDGKGSMVTRSVTLLLKPDEVTKLHLAQENGGRVSLALRGNADEFKNEIAGTTVRGLLGGDALEEDPPPEAAKVVPKPAELAAYEPPQPVITQMAEPDRWSIQVISGNDMKLMDFWKVNGRWEIQYDPADVGGRSRPTQPDRRDSAKEPDDFGWDRDQNYAEEGQSADE